MLQNMAHSCWKRGGIQRLETNYSRAVLYLRYLWACGSSLLPTALLARLPLQA